MTHTVRLINVISVLILTCIIIGCGPKREALPQLDDSISEPFQEFENTTLVSYSGKFKRWTLKSDYMRKPLVDTGKIMASPVRITLFDSLGNQGTFILADSGSTEGNMGSFIVWGDVYIRNQNGMIIRTQKLWWHKDRQKVESNTFVQIETKKGDVLRGKGLDATEDFSKFSFRSEISGRFPDFKRRLEAEDDFL